MKAVLSIVCAAVITIVVFVDNVQAINKVQYNNRFVGVWLIEQPYHALYEANLFRFNSNGSIELTKQLPAGDYTGTVCSISSGKSCVFGNQWYSLGPDTLVISSHCDDSVKREITLLFPDSNHTECQNPYIWCGEPILISYQNDTSWNHCDFQWRWIRCVQNEQMCMIHFTNNIKLNRSPENGISKSNKIDKISYYSINGKKLINADEINKNRIIIEEIEYIDGQQNTHLKLTKKIKP
jgi:hypothetical protein